MLWSEPARINLGTAVSISTLITDTTPDKNSVDPSTVQLTVEDGAGNTTTYTYGSGDNVIQRLGVGSYSAILTPQIIGWWRVGWLGSGNYGVSSFAAFRVVGING